MSVNTIENEIRKYLEDKTATNPICDSLGTTLTYGTNLFMYEEPSSGFASQCITILSYGGSPPNKDRRRQEPSVQIRLKTNSNTKANRTMQAIINDLHGNDRVCASQPGKLFAVQSNPIRLAPLEGGEIKVTVSNYNIKHVKL